MRIATYNANSIRTRLPAILDWLDAFLPDVLAIQETKVQDADFPKDEIEEAGWHVVYRGQKSYNGVALISGRPADDVRFGLDDDGPADETRLIHATYAGLQVINTYVPQGRDLDHEMYAYKLEWFRRLKAYFGRHCTTDQPVVWLGDLNVAPTDQDVYTPETKRKNVCFHDDVKAAFADTVSWGFTDIFRKHCPKPGQYSFFDYRLPDALETLRGWRIDHILATPPLTERSTAAAIDVEPRRLERPSDHTFMYADFN